MLPSFSPLSVAVLLLASQQVAAQTIFCDCNLNFRSFPQATQNVCNFMRNNQGFQATFSLSNNKCQIDSVTDLNRFQTTFLNGCQANGLGGSCSGLGL